MRTLTDSLKAPYPTTLACLIPPSLPSWWLLHCPHLSGWFLDFSSVCLCLLFAAYILYYFCVCLYDAIRPLGCDVMLLKSYHIISTLSNILKREPLKFLGLATIMLFLDYSKPFFFLLSFFFLLNRKGNLGTYKNLQTSYNEPCDQ